MEAKKQVTNIEIILNNLSENQSIATTTNFRKNEISNVCLSTQSK